MPIAAIVFVVVGAVTCAVAAWRGARALRRAPRPVTRDISVEPPLEPPAAPEGRRVIAVVGIDRYPDWPRLDNAVSDAKGAMALFQRYGFELPRRRDGSEVTPLLDQDATSDAIRALITEDLEQLDHKDSLVVFFAGHGHTVPRPFPDGVVTTGYMIPVDGGPSGGSARRWLRVDTLLSDIARLPPHHILVILDACNSGIALQSLSSFVKLRKAPSPGRRDRRSRRVITSARDDQSARDNGPVQGHSVFTGCLIEGFETSDIAPRRTQVTGTEIGVYLERRVAEYTREAQTPDCGAFEFDQRGDMVIELAPAAPPALAELSEVAAGALGRRSPLPIVPLAVGAIGLATLSFGLYLSLTGDVTTPPVAIAAPPASGDPCLAARDSIVRSNPFLPIYGSSTLQTYEISEQEWYAAANCRPVESTIRIAKANITARDAAAFCQALGGSLPSIEMWKAAYACANARDNARCAFEHLGDGVEELTSETDDSDPNNKLVYVIGGSSIMHPKDPTVSRRIPADHSGPVTGARCARKAP